MVNNYLHRLYDTIISRGYIEVEQLAFNNQSPTTTKGGGLIFRTAQSG